ncbi:hypothetical protein CEXT_4661 [Caerostris extrusa]|uniref:Helitron helicase-like domain-containing protein n=1 Tax=Caerostris extrusa TaxID=172846 RepID=A0AAV4NRV8_CAEEX|nr:hypothetical protein CEXT_4661 [Caerostris extrusa]
MLEDIGNNFGRLMILSSSDIGNPNYMHEYAIGSQDAIACVRFHGRPDLFTAFTYNPAWDDVQQLFFLGNLLWIGMISQHVFSDKS